LGDLAFAGGEKSSAILEKKKLVGIKLFKGDGLHTKVKTLSSKNLKNICVPLSEASCFFFYFCK